MKIEKFKYNIDEQIEIKYRVYGIEKSIDSARVEARYFEIINGPSQRSKNDKDGYHIEFEYSFRALKPGRIKLPKLIVFYEGKKIKSEDLFIEIIGKEFTSEDLKPVEYKVGHLFNINLPDYMDKTFAMNDSATIEYKSKNDDAYGYVIFDAKENIQLSGSVYNSVNEYYDDVIKDFMTNEQNRKVSNPQYLKKGDIKFIETEMTFLHKENNKSLYYFIAIAETKKAFYRFISWTSEEDQEKFKGDFQNILYSIKD